MHCQTCKYLVQHTRKFKCHRFPKKHTVEHPDLHWCGEHVGDKVVVYTAKAGPVVIAITRKASYEMLANMVAPYSELPDIYVNSEKQNPKDIANPGEEIYLIGQIRSK